MGQRLTILFVEDDPDVRAILPDYLPEDQFRTLIADSSFEAIRLLAEKHVDLMITDLVMPGVGGRDLAEQARLLCPDLRIMFMTGYYADGLEAEKIGRVLFKPVRPEQMETAIRQYLFGAPEAFSQDSPVKPPP